MKWAITLDASADVQSVVSQLNAAGVTVDPDERPVPMADNAIVVQADGPDPLPRAIRELPGVRAIHRLSGYTLY